MSQVSAVSEAPTHNPNLAFIVAMKTESDRLKTEVEKVRAPMEQNWAKGGRESNISEVRADGPGTMRMRWSTDEASLEMSIIIESVKGAGRNAQPNKDSFLIVTRFFRDNSYRVFYGNTARGYTIVDRIVRECQLGSSLREKVTLTDKTWSKLLQLVAKSFAA